MRYCCGTSASQGLDYPNVRLRQLSIASLTAQLQASFDCLIDPSCAQRIASRFKPTQRGYWQGFMLPLGVIAG